MTRPVFAGIGNRDISGEIAAQLRAIGATMGNLGIRNLAVLRVVSVDPLRELVELQDDGVR